MAQQRRTNAGADNLSDSISVHAAIHVADVKSNRKSDGAAVAAPDQPANGDAYWRGMHGRQAKRVGDVDGLRR